MKNFLMTKKIILLIFITVVISTFSSVKSEEVEELNTEATSEQFEASTISSLPTTDSSDPPPVYPCVCLSDDEIPLYENDLLFELDLPKDNILFLQAELLEIQSIIAAREEEIEEVKRRCPDEAAKGNCLNAKGKRPERILHLIEIPDNPREPFYVSCNQKVHGGGWLVLLRREDGGINFYKNWTAYKDGFGDLETEFWIGLDKMHELTHHVIQELLVVFEHFNGTKNYARYDFFSVGDESEKYILSGLGKFSGDTIDTFAEHAGKKFSTQDQISENTGHKCGDKYRAGWWYTECFGVFLTGRYTLEKVSYYTSSITWIRGNEDRYGLKFVEMMIRPREYWKSLNLEKGTPVI